MGIKLNGSFEQSASLVVVISRKTMDERQGALIEFPRLEVFRRATRGAGMFDVLQISDQRNGDGFADLVLDGKNIGDFAVIGPSPDLLPRARVDQLRRDARPVARLPNASFDNIVDAELSSDLLYLGLFPFPGEARIARNDGEAS